MKTRKNNCKPELRQLQFSKCILVILLFMMFYVTETFAQNITANSANSASGSSETSRTLFGGRITNSGYGGIVLKFSSFDDQFAFMTGGRGAITINDRFTIGGAGYGIANTIKLPGSGLDTSRYFKMGYGGVELGYILYTGEKTRIGSSLLIAAGAAFWQNKPKSDGEKLFDNDFKIFPVLEPSLYSEFALNRFIWLHAGISYRYVHHAHLDYITDKSMRGLLMLYRSAVRQAGTRMIIINYESEVKMKRFSNISIIKKGGRIMLIVLSFLLVCILIISGALLVYSPGTAKPLLDESGKPLQGSISEKVFVNINGVRQGMFIKSRNAANPVLLYLHGGMPDYFLTEKYPTGLENYFTMVWWEQRGSGLSYSKTIPPATMTPAQMISDTKEVTNYLRNRFGKEAYDYTCSYAEAKRYFEKLKAPVKGFYIFEKSAHSPFFEEPGKMQKIIREDVLAGVNNIADIK